MYLIIDEILELYSPSTNHYRYSSEQTFGLRKMMLNCLGQK